MINKPSHYTNNLPHLEAALREAHHGVKNTLQNIVSYINIIFEDQESISKQDVKKITVYINIMSSIHDQLLEEVKYSGNKVRLEKILSTLLEPLKSDGSIQYEEIPSIRCSPRKASTICLVLLELLDNSTSLSKGNTFLRFREEQKSLHFELTSSNIRLNSAPKHSLKLAKLLVESELKSQLVINQEDEIFSASFSFYTE